MRKLPTLLALGAALLGGALVGRALHGPSAEIATRMPERAPTLADDRHGCMNVNERRAFEAGC